MYKGIIVKGIGGFYYVRYNKNIYECKARGKFRKQNIKPLVGDYVHFTYNDHTKQGAIEEILNRKVELKRPPVANVDQVIIVFAIKNPNLDIKLLDKLLIMGEYHNLDLKICINKIDNAENSDIEYLNMIYKNTPYELIFSSVKQNIGLNKIKNALKNKITVFAGPSGVGKSSILNSIQKGFELKTGDISKKIKRGKHTTRHTELLELDLGGWVVDTPGFTSLDIDYLETENLDQLFPEFRKYLDMCRFSNCIHINEPGCAIKKALDEGKISNSRYDNYVYFTNQLQEANKWRY